jgi:hypothetical protein
MGIYRELATVDHWRDPAPYGSSLRQVPAWVRTARSWPEENEVTRSLRRVAELLRPDLP